MLQNKDIETLRMLFSSHNYVMTTAELIASKLYYADIKQLLGNKAWILGYFISEIIAFWEKMVIFDNKTLFFMFFFKLYVT